MDQIKLGLQQRGCVIDVCVHFKLVVDDRLRKKHAPAEEPLFQCLAMLASAVGPNLTKLLHDQLDLIFDSQLSEPLRLALESIARHIPPLLKTIQDRLLDMISTILSGQLYRPLGAPAQYARPDITNLKDYTIQVRVVSFHSSYLADNFCSKTKRCSPLNRSVWLFTRWAPLTSVVSVP